MEQTQDDASPRTPSPSHPTRIPRASSPETVRSPQSETDAIASSLAARRRRSLPSILSAHGANKGKAKGKARQADEQAIEEDEEDFDEEGARRVKDADIDAYDASKGRPIEILKGRGNRDGEQGEVEGEEFDPEEECVLELQPEYVWDVLFENQRGIYLLGKGYFSSRTLLPSDPSPFTRPSTDLLSASSFSIVDASGRKRTQRAKPNSHDPQNSAEASQDPGQSSTSANGQKSSAPRARSNKTSYTLETYQTPLPDWQYLTPWLINMRVGTDEGGWRYNAWFKRGGWSSHAGPVGWGGWVRRREWVRLRYVVQHETGAGLVDMSARETIESKIHRLEEVLSSSEVNENTQNVLKTMGRLGLDRQRMELWAKWIDNETQGSQAWGRLEELCKNEQSTDLL